MDVFEYEHFYICTITVLRNVYMHICITCFYMLTCGLRTHKDISSALGIPRAAEQNRLKKANMYVLAD